jgi:hypothetical protein
MLVRQTILLDAPQIALTPLLRYSCKLFVALAKVKAFGISQIRTLLPEHPGGVYLAKNRPAESATYKLFFPDLLANELPLLCFQEVTNCSLQLVVLSPLCFHTLTNCFSRKPLVFTTMRIARGVGVRSVVPTLRRSDMWTLLRRWPVSFPQPQYPAPIAPNVSPRQHGQDAPNRFSGAARLSNRR